MRHLINSLQGRNGLRVFSGNDCWDFHSHKEIKRPCFSGYKLPMPHQPTVIILLWDIIKTMHVELKSITSSILPLALCDCLFSDFESILFIISHWPNCCSCIRDLARCWVVCCPSVEYSTVLICIRSNYYTDRLQWLHALVCIWLSIIVC